MADFFQKIGEKLENVVGQELKQVKHLLTGNDDDDDEAGRVSQGSTQAAEGSGAGQQHRFGSFAPQSSGHVKWYVDGASYFWAVSLALEQARESIYILDWWLSPELYLRRPPAANEQYRLDKMLRACAERGVQVNVIVYKEVSLALTLDSAHTKHALEALHPNIRVFRHPDHVLSGNDLASEVEAHFSNLSMRTCDLATLSHDAIKSIYGASNDAPVLFWAHHEKLCIVDRRIAFMGGLDLCFGRWDTNSHPIADVHPRNMDELLYPGQDYNNARIYDFEDVGRWENNKLDRTKSSRMGWSDISISLTGPVVTSLIMHFTDRWNYIHAQKYENVKDSQDRAKYVKLQPPPALSGSTPARQGDEEHGFRGLHLHFRFSRAQQQEDQVRQEPGTNLGGAHVQLTRSCCPWSSGHATEHSIANAYIDAITQARHFVYIENQFFITATSDKQSPVENKIGAAIVDRIVRAWRENSNFHIIVVMPAVPAFAGDLQSDGALGTRAIMEYQYNSINRGGHSIIETLVAQGVTDPHRYINFFNLRNYDRINTSDALRQVERESGVPYESARGAVEKRVERGLDGDGPHDSGDRDAQSSYLRYQDAARRVRDETPDSVSACYMAGGPELSALSWNGSPESEMKAFVSEELYIHSKVLIADDHVVICGSANLNDRSQLGSHDSEMAVVIEDPTPVPSHMDGADYVASAFAASLRRQLFRKHLGLLPDQPPRQPGGDLAHNWTPVSAAETDGNAYDWGSEADRLVEDPLSPAFRALWRDTARTNTEVFSRAFHNVPNDKVRTWAEYDDFFARHFILPGADAGPATAKATIDYGHVVTDEFPGGVNELKAWLGRVRGNLVEMPLKFLSEVKDLAKKGLSLNDLTDELYT